MPLISSFFSENHVPATMRPAAAVEFVDMTNAITVNHDDSNHCYTVQATPGLTERESVIQGDECKTCVTKSDFEYSYKCGKPQ